MTLVYSPAIFAQNSWGVRVAANSTNIGGEPEYVVTRSLLRFQAGAFAKRYLHKNWYAKVNLLYNQKGNFHDDTHYIADGGKKVDIKLNYAEVSIDAGYSFRIKNNWNVHAALGPYLAYGINGSETGESGSIYGPGILKIDRRVDFISGYPKGGNDLELKQWDAGANFNVELQFKDYGLFVNYGMGLANRENFGKSFNRVLSVGLSYSFNFNKGVGCFATEQ